MSVKRAHSPAEAERSQPAVIPRRFWWFKRLALLAAVLAVVMPLLHWGWLSIGKAKLAAEDAWLRSRNMPVLLSHFQPPDLADTDNAATYYDLAASFPWRYPDPLSDINEALDLLTAWDSQADAISNFPDIFDALFQQNEAGLCLIRSGRFCEGMAWPSQRLSSPWVGAIPALSYGPRSRHLAKWTAVAAEYYARSGQSDAAIESALDGLAISRHLYSAATLFDYWIAVATYELMLSQLELVIAAIGDGERELALTLLAELRHDDLAQAALARALLFERFAIVDSVNLAVSGHKLAPGTFSGLERASWLTGPFLLHSAVAISRHARQFVHFVDREPVPVESLQHVHGSASPGGLLDTSGMLRRLLFPPMDTNVLVHRRAIARRRMAALALAMRLCELDHGQRPARLSLLVPEYLERLPVDPFHPAGASFGLVIGGRGSRLYSVGSDGVDSGGVYYQRMKAGLIDPDRGDAPVFFLELDRPAQVEQAAFGDPAKFGAVVVPGEVPLPKPEGTAVGGQAGNRSDAAAASAPRPRSQ